MIALFILILIGAYALYQKEALEEITGSSLSSKISERLDVLWSDVQKSLKENRFGRAEKLLLMILRVDERNASAYNRLGIIYVKERNYKDAIECFEIAQSLEPSASSLHNVGLIYFETKDYEKAALAFEQALEIDSDLSTRHIAYAKVQEKLGNDKKMVAALERAVELDPIPQTLNILADAYERTGREDLALVLREKAAKLIIPEGQPKRIRQPRRVIM